MASKVKKPAEKSKAPVRRTVDGRVIPPNAGKGRKKGVPNKSTKTAKEAIAMLADGMTGELQHWLRAAAYGVGRVFVPWEPKDEGEEPPVGARRRGKEWIAPLCDKKGRPVMVGLNDVMAGTLPADGMVEWIVKPQPGASTDTMLRALEYHIPKLSRAELTGPGGSALVPAQINVNGVKAPRRE